MKGLRLLSRWAVAAASGMAAIAASFSPLPAQAAYPANGTLMGSVNFSHQCSSGIGVGVAFDGTYLWYTCYASNPDLLRAVPSTGVVTAQVNIDGGLGAIAYDATRNAIWAAPGGGAHYGQIWKITLDALHNVSTTTMAFNAGGDADGLTDGIGFDATDDTLYFKPDNSNPIHHYTTAGVKLADITGASSCFGPATSGLAIGGNLLFEGKDGCNHVFVVDKKTQAAAFDFSTQIAGDPNFRDEGLTCDNKTFAPVDVMWSKEAYSPMRAHAFAIPQGTCGVGGKPPGGGPPPDGYLQFTTQTSMIDLYDQAGNKLTANSSSPGTFQTENGPVPVVIRTYTFSVAGSDSTTIWTECTTDNLNCSIVAIKYDAGQMQTPTQNLLSAQFYKDEDNYTSFNQQVFIGGEFEQAEWNRDPNTTTINHVMPDPSSTQTLPGMVLLQIWTTKGNVKFAHT